MKKLTLPLFPLLGIEADGSCECGPDCEAPGKHPAVSWKAEVGEERFRSVETYLSAHPRVQGVGARMGEGIFVLDFDPRSGGFDSLARLEGEFSDLPPTAVALTGLYGSVRGEHWYFTYDASETYIRSRPLSKVLGADYSGVDVKGEGGYVVLPPTRHRSRVRYAWKSGLERIAEAPDWLITLLESEPELPSPTAVGTALRKRRGGQPSREVQGWIYGKAGVPHPQWVKIARITAALWDDTEAESPRRRLPDSSMTPWFGHRTTTRRDPGTKRSDCEMY